LARSPGPFKMVVMKPQDVRETANGEDEYEP
jgi:hypothetical protein